MIVVGTFSFVLILLTISILQKISSYIAAHSKNISLYVEVEKEEDIETLLGYMRSNGCKLYGVEKWKDKVSKKHVSIMLDVIIDERTAHSELIEKISKVKGVLYVEEA